MAFPIIRSLHRPNKTQPRPATSNDHNTSDDKVSIQPLFDVSFNQRSFLEGVNLAGHLGYGCMVDGDGWSIVFVKISNSFYPNK